MTRAQTAHLKRAFLERFRIHGNVTTACEQAGIQRRATVYGWQEHDETFALEFRQAEIEATEHMEAEAHRRAVEGVEKEKAVFHNGQIVGMHIEREYSDTLLIFMLKARAPEKYRERHDLTWRGHLPAGQPAPVEEAKDWRYASLGDDES